MRSPDVTTPPTPRLPRTAILVKATAALLLVAASVAPFLPAVEGEFLNWDDNHNFLLHAQWRGLSWTHLRWMFTNAHYGDYHPLAWLSYGLDHELWGMNPRGYHATNLFLHSVNALLLAAVLAEILTRAGASRSRAFAAAAASAAIWAAHPLRVESVAWITERRGLLAATFWLLCVGSYLKAWGTSASPRTRFLLLATATLCFLLSVLSKAMGITLPAVLLVLDSWPLKRAGGDWRSWWRLLVEKIPFVLIAGAVALAVRSAQSAGGALRSWTEHPAADRLIQSSYGLAFYVVQSLVPSHLSPLHPMDRQLVLTETRFLASVAAVLAAAAILWWARRRFPFLIAAAVAYVMILLPVLGFAQSGPQLVAERYSYLAATPLHALAAGVLAVFMKTRNSRRCVLATVAVATLALGGAAMKQSRIWKTSVSLWESAVREYPDSPSIRLALAEALAEKKLHDAALVHLSRSVVLAPHALDGWFQLGLSAYHTRNYELAFQAWTRAAELAPTDVRLPYYLGVVHHAGFSRQDEALRWADRALAIDPGHTRSLALKSQALIALGRSQEAVPVLIALLDLDPEYPEARSQLEALRR